MRNKIPFGLQFVFHCEGVQPALLISQFYVTLFVNDTVSIQ